MRPSGRAADELRSIKLTRHYTKHAAGSTLIEVGETKVLCTASIDNRCPPWLKGTGSGWVTAEYGMLPSATHTRSKRESTTGKQSGRTQEIQRLIGRSLRAAVDLDALGERTITLDCDVLQADGGTRTASITGAYVALCDAVELLLEQRKIKRNPIHGQIAAISVGIVSGDVVLDLDYEEDSAAETDMNVVMNEANAFIEIQGTAEGHAFRDVELQRMLALAKQGVSQLIKAQRHSLNTDERDSNEQNGDAET